MGNVIWYHKDGTISHPKELHGEELIRNHYERLKVLRTNYSNNIPEELIHSTSPDNKFKVRKAWWTSMCLRIEDLRKLEVLSVQTLQKYHKVIEQYHLHLDENGLTRSEDIQNANELLDGVLADLENKLDLKSKSI